MMTKEHGNSTHWYPDRAIRGLCSMRFHCCNSKCYNPHCVNIKLSASQIGQHSGTAVVCLFLAVLSVRTLP